MGSKLLFYLVILPVSKLPFWTLYLISDFLYLVLYKIIGYRTKVVRQNLTNSFPDKSEKEILALEAKFYSHLCDLVVESLKAFNISLEEAKLRMKDRNIEVVNQYFKQGRQVVLVGGHYGNWELFAITIGATTDHKTLALYTPLKNQFINEKITKSRSKYGLGMLSIKEIKSKLNDINSDFYAIIFGADQSPRKSQRAYWMKFLNKETGVQFGTEKFAKEFNAVVIFTNIYKVKRGYYELQYDVITEQPNQEELGFISKTHTQMLEKVIQEQPEYWLWSHKRWKHKRPEGEVLN
ncbi:lysophospholipid acyltransferase family protein [Vicingaceae bacterium]|nr:lysophospholipid acyltransferase family protein [Vicingaceae bacterium]